MSGICYIFGAGERLEKFPAITEDSFVIAADAGYGWLCENGVVPDIVMGDFDSLGSVPVHGNVIKFKTEKDDTDTSLALDEGVRRGYKRFAVYGATGGRLDHTLANIQCIAKLSQQGIDARLYGRNCEIIALTNGKIEFSEAESGIISVFSFTDESQGVAESGLKYTLSGRTLTNNVPLGVSNEFIGERAAVSVEKGTLVIIKTGVDK